MCIKSSSKGGDVPNPTYILSSFQTVCYKDIPSFGGAWGGFFLGWGFTLPLVHSLLYSPSSLVLSLALSS